MEPWPRTTGGSAWLRFSPLRWWSVIAFGSAGAMGRWIALVESNRAEGEACDRNEQRQGYEDGEAICADTDADGVLDTCQRHGEIIRAASLRLHGEGYTSTPNSLAFIAGVILLACTARSRRRSAGAGRERSGQHPHAASACVENHRAGKKAFFGGWEPGTVFGPAAHFAAEDLKFAPLNT